MNLDTALIGKKMLIAGVGVLAFTAALAGAAIEITPDHIVSGSATGALIAVDVPFNDSTGAAPVFGGPDWVSGGGIVAHPADQGFATLSSVDGGAGDGLRGSDSGNNVWEPDGTPFVEAKGFFTFDNGPAPSVTWVFDLPDGAVINAIYAARFSFDLIDWSSDLDDSISAERDEILDDGDQLTVTFDLVAAGATGKPDVFFRIEELPAAPQ